MGESKQPQAGTAAPVPAGFFIPFAAEQPPLWSLGDLRKALIGHWRMIAGATAAGAIVLAALAFATKPVWRSEVLLAVVESDTQGTDLRSLLGSFSGVAAVAGIALGPTHGGRSEAVATLRSRSLAEAFLRDRQLLPVIFADEWDAASGNWADPDDVPTMGDAYEVFDRDIRFVTEDPETGLVRIAIEWKDRELAAQWATDLVHRANSSIRSRVIANSEKDLKYLQGELAKTNIVGVQQAIYEVIEGQIKATMLASTREDYAFRIIDPASVPDADDPVRPKRAIMVALGIVMGGSFGIVAALFAFARSRAAGDAN